MAEVYPTDLTDEQWAIIEPLLPPAKRGGRPRTADLRAVLNTIFYLTRTGCQWSMLPTDLAKRSTANDYFAAWQRDGTWQAVTDALRRQVRVAAGRGRPRARAAQGGDATPRRSRGARRAGTAGTTGARRSTAGNAI